MNRPTEDINMEFAIELYDKVKEICMDTSQITHSQPDVKVK